MVEATSALPVLFLVPIVVTFNTIIRMQLKPLLKRHPRLSIGFCPQCRMLV